MNDRFCFPLSTVFFQLLSLPSSPEEYTPTIVCATSFVVDHFEKSEACEPVPIADLVFSCFHIKFPRLSLARDRMQEVLALQYSVATTFLIIYFFPP